MSEPDDNNTRDELCRRFRSDLAQPESQRFYSEDDLIDIFDYAGDLGDDYLRMEALLLGARLYPDSLDLRERRAIFYLYLDPAAFKSFLDDNMTMDSPLWQILRLNLLRPGEPNAPEILSAFLDHVGELSDEEVIQFVQLAGSVGQTDWLLSNLDKLRHHVTYLPTLLYEAAAQAEDAGKYEQAAALVAELTDLEPYNADFWTMHATLNVLLNRKDEAAADIDYALAIDPENVEARRAKLGVVADCDDHTEFNALVDGILAQNPADADVTLMALENADSEERATEILDKVVTSIAWTYDLAARAAALSYEKLDVALRGLVEQGLTDPDEWRAIAKAAFDAGNYPAVSVVMKEFSTATGSDLDCTVYLYAMLFRSQCYDMVVQMYMSSGDSTSLAEGGNTFKATAMFIIAMLRLDMADTARSFATRLLEEIDKVPVMSGDELNRFGLRTFVADVVTRLSPEVPPTNWHTYNPLGI